MSSTLIPNSRHLARHRRTKQPAPKSCHFCGRASGSQGLSALALIQTPDLGGSFTTTLPPKGTTTCLTSYCLWSGKSPERAVPIVPRPSPQGGAGEPATASFTAQGSVHKQVLPVGPWGFSSIAQCLGVLLVLKEEVDVSSSDPRRAASKAA